MRQKPRGAALPARKLAAPQKLCSTPRVDVPALAREVLLHLLALTAPAYSTRRGEGPPGYSVREWRALAHRVGTRRGRYHYVTAAELAAHEHAGREVTPVAPATPGAWSPADAADEMGLRVITGGPR